MTEQLVYASCSLGPRRGSMVSYATVPACPLQPASRGWSSPAILPTWDRTNNRKVISPTPSPLNQRGDVFSVQIHVYIPLNMWKCHRNWKNWNFKNMTLPGIEPRSSVSLLALLPLNHRFLSRINISENINLIRFLVFSHRAKTSKRLQLIPTLTWSNFLEKSKFLKMIVGTWKWTYT
jgi:hypothetical protein